MSKEKIISIMVLFLIVSVSGVCNAVVIDPAASGQTVLPPFGNLVNEESGGQQYVPDVVIIKYKKDAANKLATGLSAKKKLKEIKVSESIDDLNEEYNAQAIKPIFKNIKAYQAKIKKLQKKDKSKLSKRENHLLKRLKRAPLNAKKPALERIYKFTVEIPDGETLEDVIEWYNNSPDVEYAEPDYIIHGALTPNDPNYPVQWALNNTGQDYPSSGKYNDPPGTAYADIDAPEAWDISTGSSDIIVAVIDTGVDYNHRDINDNMWTDPNGFYGYDYVNDDNDPIDDHGHGTHCAGIIAAEGNNNQDITGVCWNTKIMALKFLNEYNGGGTNSNAIAAFGYAIENGADVLSNSWFGTYWNESLQEIIDYAYSEGIMVVACAGNWPDGDRPAPVIPVYPANYNHVIAVAATDSNDDLAIFPASGFVSSFGDWWVDIAAPGVDILSLRASGTSMGTVNNAYTTVASGTSMACPHVAGACATILSRFEELSVDMVEGIIMDTADQLTSLEGRVASGRLNLHHAVSGIYNIQKDQWYETIQGAIDDADTDDEIVVYPGTRQENIDFLGKAITVRSIDPDDWNVVAATVIDANDTSGSVVTFDSGEDVNSILTGFTIQGGYKGIDCYETGAVISNCIIEGNSWWGIHSDYSSTIIRNNKIGDNRMGMRCRSGNEKVINNWIYDNPTAGIKIASIDPCDVTVTEITNNTIVNNTNYGIDQGLNDPTPVISNCILWDNGDDLDGFSATFSCYSGGSGTNIGTDPNFVDADNDDYHLTSLSPCINAGDPCGNYAGQTDIDGEPRVMGGGIVDIGADEFIGIFNLDQDEWYDSIQAAIDDESTTTVETIEVGPGIYYENIDFGGNDMVLMSIDPCNWDIVEATIIDANDTSGSVVTFDSGEDVNSILTGFTIQGGYKGIDCDSSGSVISNCIIKDNSQWGLHCDYASTIIRNNKISGNWMGMRCRSGSEKVINNLIYDNTTAGIKIASVDPCDVTTPEITNNTIVNNSNYGINKGSGDYLLPVISNCILWDNGDDLDGFSATYSCYSGGSGSGNIGSDPNFVDAESDDYHLQHISPCIDAGTDGGIYTDIDGNIRPVDIPGVDNNEGHSTFDMGAYEVLPVIFVDDDAPGTNSGTSWFDAYNDLQSALSIAISGNQIRVAQGTYKPGTDRSDSFQMISGVELYGGYAGYDEADPDARNIELYETILSGDIGTLEYKYDNSYHVVVGSSTDSTAVIDGFTIIAGRADSGPNDYDGGGMYNYFGSPTVTNCTFTSCWTNEDGSGMYNYSSNPTVTNCIFTDNIGGHAGGGMCNEETSNPTVTNCAFTANNARTSGGGILNISSNPTVTNCIFTDNNGGHAGGGMCNEDSSSPTVTNCTFADNTVESYGSCGGVYNDDSTPTLTNCILWANSTPQIENYDSSPVITYCDVQGGYPGTGNIDDDPCFVDASNYDYYLLSTSPCIDAADGDEAPTTDIDGQGRYDDPYTANTGIGDPNYVDMGAYEYQGD